MKLLYTITFAVGLVVSAAQARETTLLWYEHPATNWQTSALPIGNGKLGAMLFGQVERERIMFNEDSLWIGDEGDTGSYQAFGDVYITLHPPKKPDHGASYSNYHRQLDIDTAIHTVHYTYDGINYTREAFSSAPASVMVFHFTADKNGAHSGYLELTDRHQGAITDRDATLTAKGNLHGYVYQGGSSNLRPGDSYDINLDYESQVNLVYEGGQARTHEGKIHFKDCDSLTVFIAAGTNYINQRDQGWTTDHPHARLTQQLKKAANTPYATLKANHINDYQNLYRRFKAELPTNDNSWLPTDERLEAYQEDSSDHALEVLQLHYARYLMIACSRPGSLPANLQGMWCDSLNPPWRSDYHSDVNLQMNYWFVDQTNLSECFQPFADYQYSVRAVRRENTKKQFGDHIRGWATRSENGIFGGSSYLWVPGDAAWLAQNLWDHYAYTRDKTYLKQQAYPILKELCEFWEDYAIETNDGKLISPPSVSPEHGPKVAGNSYEDQLMYDLFTNYIEASTDLDIDADFRKNVIDMRARLLGPQIGRWGQLQEWMEDRDDPDNKHRHLSHLIAVYPGRQIAPVTTPELAKAAATSLNARGDDGTGWSIGWKINLWARLYEGNRAYNILSRSLRRCNTTRIVMNNAGGTYDNLLMAHPPYQIEANFGYASGFCELLMQSHLGELHLLPCLPKAWPNGKISGLKARGNYEIDMEWADGELKKATIKSLTGSTPKVRIGNDTNHVNLNGDPRIRLIKS